MKKKLLLLTLLLCFLCVMTAGAQASAEIQTQASTETADLVAQAEALKEAGDYDAAFPLFQKAADAGDPVGQLRLGTLYIYGQGVEKNEEEAAKYYRLSAEQGNCEAMYELGICYMEGEGVEQDYEKAAEYYRQAADQGLDRGQFSLGYMYEFGLGVKRDYEKALAYYRLAAEQELPVAMFGVGDCFLFGNGVEQDLNAAAEWYQKALDAGYEPDETDQRHLDALAEGREAVEPDIGRLTLIAANSCDALLSRHKSIMMDMDIYAPDGLYATQKFYVDPDVSYCALSANAYSTVMTRDCFIEYLWDFDDPVYYLFDDLDVYEDELAAQRKGFPIVANEDTEILYRTVEGDGLFTAYSRVRDPAFIRSFIRDAEEGSDWFHYQEGMELLQKEVFDTNSSDLLYTEVNLLYPDGKEYLYVTYEFAYDVDIHDVDEYLSAYADITDDNSRTVTVTFAPGTEEERSVEYQMVKGAYYYLWYKDQEVLVDYDDPACTVLHETSDGTEDMHIYVKESPDAADLVKQAKMLMDAENYGAAVDVLWEAAEMGDPTGLRWLGNCYANGQGVEKNDEEAVRYYRLASEQGDVLADYNLALCYLDGSGVEQDPEKAKELLLSCADRGDAESANKLGCLYYDGEGLAQNYEEAFKLFRQAADMGYMRAYGNLGVCYENGFGVEQDDVKAAECYLTAAEAGDEYGLYNLGILYRLGKGVEQDDEKAFEYASLAAAQDNAEALTALGYYYGFGVGTEQDYDEMLKYYRLAAERGEPTALFNLGCCYRDATGVEKDYEEMLRYFRLAADAGNPDAQFNLGYCYYIGQGVDQDYDTAVEFFRQAAEQELPVAMFAYGDCFYLGNGAEQDLNAAAKWYQRALNAGYEPDETDRQHLADLLGKAAF